MRIVSQTWQPDARDIHSTEFLGSWVQSGDQITLTYEDNTDILRFSAGLSFREFGCDGHGPGVRGIQSSGEYGLFYRTSLWSTEALKQVPDPC